jgi:hypothetical protein
MSNNTNEIRDTDVISLIIIVWMKCASLLALFLTCITFFKKRKKLLSQNKTPAWCYIYILLYWTFLYASRWFYASRWYVRAAIRRTIIINRNMHFLFSLSIYIRVCIRIEKISIFSILRKTFFFSLQTFSQCFFVVSFYIWNRNNVDAADDEKIKRKKGQRPAHHIGHYT